MEHPIEPGQHWRHRTDGRTIRVETTTTTANGYVEVTNTATGRTSTLRKSTLTRGYTRLSTQDTTR